jgi:hypothetical protein
MALPQGGAVPFKSGCKKFPKLAELLKVKDSKQCCSVKQRTDI